MAASGFTRLGVWPDYSLEARGGGGAAALVVEGNIACLEVNWGQGQLLIFDLSDPGQPRFMSSWKSNDGGSGVLRMENQRVWVGTRYRMTTLDVSEPADPVVLHTHELETINFGGTEARLKAVGDVLISLPGNFPGKGEVRILDNADPLRPHYLSQVLVQQERDFAVVGSRLYTVGRARLHVTDISDPAHPGPPKKVEYLPLDLERIVATDTTAWVAAGENGLYVLDLAQDPERPPVIAHWTEEPLHATALQRVGDRLFVASREKRLEIFDIQDRAAPRKLGQMEALAFEVVDMRVQGDFAYLSSPKVGLVVVDVRNPSQPVLQSVTPISGLFELAMREHQLCLQSPFFFHLLDLSDPSRPQSLKTWLSPLLDEGTLGGGDWVADRLYVSMGRTNRILGWWEMSDPPTAKPRELPGTSRPYHFWVAGNLVFAGDAEGRLEIMDASDETAPEILSVTEVGGSLVNVFVHGSLACVLTRDPVGIRTLEVSDPTAPTLLGAVDLPVPETWRMVGNARVCCVLGPLNLVIVDLENPQQPVVANVGNFTMFSAGAMQGDMAFLAGDGHCYAMDLTDPAHPTIVAIEQVGGGWDVAVEDNVVAIASYDSPPVSIWRFTPPPSGAPRFTYLDAPWTRYYYEGESFALTMKATDDTSYQWLRNGEALADTDRISGATTATLSITPLRESDAGVYQLEITNETGSLRGPEVPVVVEKPRLSIHRVGQQQQVTISWNTLNWANRDRAVLQTRTSLTEGEWEDLPYAKPTYYPHHDDSSRFYRLIIR